MGGEMRIVNHFLDGALPSFQAQVVGQIHIPHPPLADDPTQVVTPMQHRPRRQHAHRDLRGHYTTPSPEGAAAGRRQEDAQSACAAKRARR